MAHSRVNEIDLLRFLAALTVVFFHYSFRGHAADALSAMPYPLLAPASKYGYLGVELFFMISGFVILMTAANGSLRSFAISRVVRLYPAFWACCTITFLVTLAIGAPHFSATTGQYLANMTMMSGFAGVPSIDGVYWSLFVELRFYALIAVLLIIGRIHQAQGFLLAWLLAALALAIRPMDKIGFLLIADYAPYFIAGATCYLIWSKGPSPARIMMFIAAWGLALFRSIRDLDALEAKYNTRWSAYIVAAIVTAFFVTMMLVSLKRTGFLGRNRWVLVGALTYPLYLLHQYIGYMVFNIAYPAINVHVLFWGTIIAVLAGSFAVHHFFERKYSPPMKAAINSLIDRIQRRSLGDARAD